MQSRHSHDQSTRASRRTTQLVVLIAAALSSPCVPILMLFIVGGALNPMARFFKAQITIENHTVYNSAQLKAIARRAVKQVGYNKYHLVIIVEYSKCGGSSGCAYLNSQRMLVRIGRHGKRQLNTWDRASIRWHRKQADRRVAAAVDRHPRGSRSHLHPD